MPLVVQHFLHQPTCSFSYLAWDDASRLAAVIDPVLDYDPASGRTGTESAQRIVAVAKDNGLTVDWVLETHAHADHLSAAPWIKASLGGRIGIGRGICTVQKTFRNIFNLKDMNVDGRQFDHLFAEDEPFRVGGIEGRVVGTPGHTSDSISYLIGDAVFVGDTLFAPDKGTARTDFPGGSAHRLYRSTQKLLALPDETRVFLCHDYPGDERDYEYVHFVRDHRERNVHVGDGMSEAEFVRLREARDMTLGMPNLIFPSVQVNIRAGQLPDPEDNGVSYMKVPINRRLGED